MAKDKKDGRDSKDKTSGEVPGPPAREVGKWLDLSGLRKEPAPAGEEAGEEEIPAPAAENAPPARDFGSPLAPLGTSPGARKEKIRERSYPGRGRSSPPLPYAELHMASAFSFLDGASLPEDLLQQAAARELPALALMDAN